MNVHHTRTLASETHGSFSKEKCVKSATRGSLYFPCNRNIDLGKDSWQKKKKKKSLTEQSAFSSLYQKDFMK